jgi:hypothetical protein
VECENTAAEVKEAYQEENSLLFSNVNVENDPSLSLQVQGGESSSVEDEEHIQPTTSAMNG